MQRLNPFAIVPDAYKAVSGVESYIRNCGLEKSLIHLVKMRASQINGCAYCLECTCRPQDTPYGAMSTGYGGILTPQNATKPY